MNKQISFLITIIIIVVLVILVVGGYIWWQNLKIGERTAELQEIKTEKSMEIKNPEKIDISEIDLSTFDFSQCFKSDPERVYRIITNRPDLTERLEYTVKDDKGNYLQDLLILHYKESKIASSNFAAILTDPRCQHVKCEKTKINNLNATRVKTEWEIRLEEGKALYNTEYSIVINEFLISSTGNGYIWEESEEYSRSAIECLIALIH